MRNRLLYTAIGCLTLGFGWPETGSSQGPSSEPATKPPSYFDVICGGEGQTRSWKLDERWTNGVKTPVLSCETDDLYTFRSDKFMEFVNGEAICPDPMDDAIGTWSYHEEMKMVVLQINGVTLQNKVVELSPGKMVFEYQEDGKTFRHTLIPKN